MGIPYYFYTIYKKYSNANNDNSLMIREQELRGLNITYLFLDYNSMIHPCAQNAIKIYIDDGNHKDLEDFIIAQCIVYTKELIESLNAQFIYIMIDGVAPRAKINQQRERRYKSQLMKNWNNNSNKNTNESTTKTVSENTNGSFIWDSNKITPGTPFMEKLSKKLQIEMQNYNNKKIFISDSDEPGEGEHKMMKIIKKLNIQENEKIFIYGLDADLIMLSLLNVRKDNIVLLRDNTFNDKLSDAQKIFTYLDINKLYKCIIQEMQGIFYTDRKEQLNKNKIAMISDHHVTEQNINDYIFLCTLLGNDFLEHIPSLIIREGGLNVILRSYCKCFVRHGNYLTQKSSLNLQFLKDLFHELSKGEDYFFKNIFNKREILYKDNNLYPLPSSCEDQEQNQNLIIYSQDLIKYNLDGYKIRYYNYYGTDSVELSCKNYIEGLYWVWGYYNDHNHDNWNWYYKYHCSPFVSDLSYYLNKNWKNLQIEFKKSEPLKPKQQLIMVLPKQSLLNIINEIDKDLVLKYTRLISNKTYFPEVIVMDMIHREYIWQSKLFLQAIPIEFVKFIEICTF